jgi:signal transduction histidine kinase
MVEDRGGERLVATLRLVVAATAVAVFSVDPSEHPERRPFVLGVLALFATYAAVSYLFAVRRGRSFRTTLAPWIDAAWVTAAVAVSQATSSLFYPMYLFPVLCASFWGGFRRGLSLAATSAVAFAAVGALTAPPGVDLRLFLVRPLYLLLLGYLIAMWGGHEALTRQRLALLRDVAALASLRHALDPALGSILEAVRAFFDADSCRLVVRDHRTGERWSRAAVRDRGVDRERTLLPPGLGDALLPVPPDAALRVGDGRGEWLERRGGAAAPGDSALAASLLVALDARALLSVPFPYRRGAAGRLWIARRAPSPFDWDDAELLGHVVDQVVPVLENLRLVDQLANQAASEERRRIALDLHDAVIQPYLGLRLGVSAARTALSAGRADEAAQHLERLAQLADGEIQTLRGYVRGLRAPEGGGAGLAGALRGFCRRFSDATGIHVEVSADDVAGDRMADDVLLLVGEALSNVRRHTTASRAEVRVDGAEGRLRVTVSSDGAPPDAPSFLPRSLAERAADLGGALTVERRGPGTTAVCVELPL